MKKEFTSGLSLLLVIVMVLATLAACGGGENTTTDIPANDTTESTSSDTTEAADTESNVTTETETDKKTDEEDTEIALKGEYADIIVNANNLANGVQDHFNDTSRSSYIIKNQNMSLEYLLTSIDDQQISYIKNTQGKTYIQNTFDVFIRMKDGGTYYASKNPNDATTNIFRYGYYYNEIRFEGQNFINGTKTLNEVNIPLDVLGSNDVSVKTSARGLRAGVSDPTDPYIMFKNINFSTDDYKYIEITLKNSKEGARATFYITAGTYDHANYDQTVSFALNSDGEYHTYTVYLGNIPDYTGMLKGLRIDFDNTDAGDRFDIEKIRLLDAEPNGLDTLSIARIFHTYSDKLHHELQLVAHEKTENIAEIGMVTNIDADKIEKIIVKDANGHHDTIDGVDWASAQYIGFDIKDVGIFGYILPVDETTGKMTVTLEDGVYSIIQSRMPVDGKVIPGEGTWEDMAGKSGNTNDFYMGQRLYTDENHTFDAFITEAEIEINPLTKRNIKVSSAYSDAGTEFIGYDPIRGSYEFYMMGTDFNSAYFQFPNRYFELNFNIRGDKYDRNIYIMTTSDTGCLECAVLLDENLMLLPVPVEVAKNFGTDKDANIYDLFDIAYGEAIVPLSISSDEKKEFNIMHLYQNWGKYPLKQLCSIEYYFPYYHLSTGVTETNCISIHYSDKGNLLPDHRSMSAPFWSTQPQHTSGGFHTLFYYTDTNGKFVATTNVENYMGSYGPTYADVTMQFKSGDGKVMATYNHMEMPQVDENRGYYTMTYEFLEDISFNDFKKDFVFYSLTNNTCGGYSQIGYLNKDNQPSYDSTKAGTSERSYVLGDRFPYFDMFDMLKPEMGGTLGYVNVSFMIYNSKIIINGEEVTPSFIIRQSNRTVYLSLDLKEVSFKAGDSITINAIIMPWGSQESIYDSSEFAPDRNVLDVRENSVIDPFKVAAGENAEVVESVFLPKVKTTNGKSAEFTISGGENNVAVRIYGFNDLSVPKVFEKVNGEWVPYVLNSADSPDISGYASYFDGYAVYYDGDGTYSYSFVTTIKDGAPRTFRIETDDNFIGWPRIETEDVSMDRLDVYCDPMEIYNVAITHPYQFENCEVTKEAATQYVHLNAKTSLSEAIVKLWDCGDEKIVTGQYFVIKYRTNAKENSLIEIFASTKNTGPQAEDSIKVLSVENDLYHPDEKWHIVVIDLSKVGGTFLPSDDGSFMSKYLRIDTTNATLASDNIYTDIAYVGLTGDLVKAVTLDPSIEDVIFYDGTRTVYSSATGEPK